VTYVSAVPYADQTYANAYFADRIGTSAWDGAVSLDQVKALRQSTRAIDRLNFAGQKHDDTATGDVPNQLRQFPRGDDVDVPDDVMQACCELALALLDGVDPNMEIENLNNAQQGISTAKVVRDTSYVQEHVRAGIPSIQAWTLLTPYLRDVQHPRIELQRGG
jgi:hypothetical protein